MRDTPKTLINILPTIMLFTACSNTSSTDNAEEQLQKKNEQNIVMINAHNGFNPNKLPHITQDIGEFPYVGVPDGYQLLLPAAFQPHDYYYFPINGQYYKFEGKLAKISVSANTTQQYSNDIFVKMLDETMSNLGAQKLNAQKVEQRLYEQIADTEDWHAISGKQEAIHTYGFINPQGNPVIIQYGFNTSPGYTIMEIQSLQNTMKFGKTAQNIIDEAHSPTVTIAPTAPTSSLSTKPK